ncbi:unnamed protein product [Moneuplotes crassus]|uniref:Uncharacterized protein n=1 Tax=Euplotes crassus TaxID=5936 RepID=A0AAD1URB5_EUPCR|nr:unnamed protein product [Moneuplotes crassus]
MEILVICLIILNVIFVSIVCCIFFCILGVMKQNQRQVRVIHDAWTTATLAPDDERQSERNIENQNSSQSLSQQDEECLVEDIRNQGFNNEVHDPLPEGVPNSTLPQLKLNNSRANKSSLMSKSKISKYHESQDGSFSLEEISNSPKKGDKSFGNSSISKRVHFKPEKESSRNPCMFRTAIKNSLADLAIQKARNHIQKKKRKTFIRSRMSTTQIPNYSSFDPSYHSKQENVDLEKLTHHDDKKVKSVHSPHKVPNFKIKREARAAARNLMNERSRELYSLPNRQKDLIEKELISRALKFLDKRNGSIGYVKSFKSEGSEDSQKPPPLKIFLDYALTQEIQKYSLPY